MRVVVADDSVILREGLARLLVEAGFEVAGQAANAEELLERVEAERPDVAIVDIRMPPTHTDEGLQAAREIRARRPEVAVLVLSQYVRPQYALELLSDAEDFAPLDNLTEFKYYCPGVGLVREEPESGTIELVRYR